MHCWWWSNRFSNSHCLSRLNIKIDFITGNNKNGNIISNRTTAISQNNYDFLKKLKIFKFSKKEFWPCSHMKLYTKGEKEKFIEIFEIIKDKKTSFIYDR